MLRGPPWRRVHHNRKLASERSEGEPKVRALRQLTLLSPLGRARAGVRARPVRTRAERIPERFNQPG